MPLMQQPHASRVRAVRDAAPRPAPADSYQARLPTPFAVVGIRTNHAAVIAIDYLAPGVTALEPENRLAERMCTQIQCYLSDPEFRFSVPLELCGTRFQQRVWQEIAAIPPGGIRTYGEIARRLASAPRAVGGACGANPIPLVVPCHRVVSGAGIGGFMNSAGGAPIAIKEWLLRHEGASVARA